MRLEFNSPTGHGFNSPRSTKWRFCVCELRFNKPPVTPGVLCYHNHYD
nr:MAG TPA: hypothetical protein [Caudoviricetes sp.]